MTSPPLGLRVRSPKIFLGVRIGIPPPPSHAAATPAGSVSRAAAWVRVLLGLRPPPPALVVPPLVRGGCGCCYVYFGFARRRRPVLRRGSRGRGVSSLGSLRLPCGCLGRGLCAPRLGLLAVAPCSPAWSWAQAALRSARAMRPPAWVCRCRAAAPSLVLGASRPAPLSSAPVLPAAACRRCASSIQQSCIPASCSPRCQTAPKVRQKVSKKRQKARFLCGISPQASLYASTDSTLISPTNGAYWAAVDAAQSPKRYFKPSTWWGAAPFRAGGKAPMPPHSSLLQPTFITAANMPALPRKYAPRQQRRISTLPPLEWLPHRLTRRAPRVYESLRRDYAAHQSAGRKAPKEQQKARFAAKSKQNAPFV